MDTASEIQQKYRLLTPLLDERQRRLWAAAEALIRGRGGISHVAAATGLSRRTIRAGIRELQGSASFAAATPGASRVRQPGGGRKPLLATNPTLLRDLEALLEPQLPGETQAPLCWTCKSTRQLAAELQAQGHHIGPRKVAQLLQGLGYMLQRERPTGASSMRLKNHAQLEHINTHVRAFQSRGQPVVVLVARKRTCAADCSPEVGDWPAGSRAEQEDSPSGQVTRPGGWSGLEGGRSPSAVRDFGIELDGETAEFAANSLRHWWREVGRIAYPAAAELLVAADGQGRNITSIRAWESAVERWADATGLQIMVCHVPMATKRWNGFEHDLTCQIMHFFQGQPTEEHEVLIGLVGRATGDPRRARGASLELESRRTRKGLEQEEFQGKWNHFVAPSQPKNG